MLKTVSHQHYIAKNAAYWLPFYGLVSILVRQEPFMELELGPDYLGLLENTFR